MSCGGRVNQVLQLSNVSCCRRHEHRTLEAEAGTLKARRLAQCSGWGQACAQVHDVTPLAESIVRFWRVLPVQHVAAWYHLDQRAEAGDDLFARHGGAPTVVAIRLHHQGGRA